MRRDEYVVVRDLGVCGRLDVGEIRAVAVRSRLACYGVLDSRSVKRGEVARRGNRGFAHFEELDEAGRMHVDVGP